MNRFTYAFALGAGLVLSLPAPSADAAPIVQQLETPTMSSSEFNSLFKPIAGASVIKAPFTFMNTPTSGTVQSQVFEGTGKAAGLYAYAYQIAVNNVTDTSGQPTSVNSASLAFNATPTPANFGSAATGLPAATYVVKDGKVGDIDLPQAAPGSVVQIPTSVAWMPGSKTGALTFQYLDASKSTGPLQGGSSGATVVVLTTQPYVNQPVSLQNANPQTSYPSAYSAQGGDIHEVPVPEPATLLAWAGMIGAAAMAHRVRRGRIAA